MLFTRSSFVVFVVAALTHSGTVASGVYRCETPDGTVTYSDTECADTDATRESVSVPSSPSADGGSSMDAQRQADSQMQQRQIRLEQAREKYRARREEIKRKMERINLGLDQTLSDMIENKARYNMLNEELQHLDRMWLNRIDPDGAQDRAAERRIRELEDRIERAESDNRGVKNTNVRIGNQTYQCQRAAGNVNCW